MLADFHCGHVRPRYDADAGNGFTQRILPHMGVVWSVSRIGNDAHAGKSQCRGQRKTIAKSIGIEEIGKGFTRSVVT